MSTPTDPSRWRKSSYSGGNGGACVEIMSDGHRIVAIRDSKNPGPTLTADMQALLTAIRSGEIN